MRGGAFFSLCTLSDLMEIKSQAFAAREKEIYGYSCAENDAAPQSSVLNEYGLLVPENERTTVEKRVFCFGLNGEGISFLPAAPRKKHQFAGLVLLQCRA
jgi:hypothetical protein